MICTRPIVVSFGFEAHGGGRTSSSPCDIGLFSVYIALHEQYMIGRLHRPGDWCRLRDTPFHVVYEKTTIK
jgi:hypothetical protein